MFSIIIYNTDKSHTIVEASKASLFQIQTWINQAPDNTNRQARKQMMHAFTYGARPQQLLNLAGLESKKWIMSTHKFEINIRHINLSFDPSILSSGKILFTAIDSSIDDWIQVEMTNKELLAFIAAAITALSTMNEE